MFVMCSRPGLAPGVQVLSLPAGGRPPTDSHRNGGLANQL
jgi:hypothetical protein